MTPEEMKAFAISELGCEAPDVPGWRIFLKSYIRDEAYKEIVKEDGTKGTLWLAPQTREEDKYRTIAGRVIAMGPLCYNENRFQGIPWCKVGDWVIFSTSNGKHRYHNNHSCYLIDDDKIDYPTSDPTLAIRDK